MKQPIKMIPGDELHLTALMAPFSLNLVTGQDRQHLLAYGRAAFEAGHAQLRASTPEAAEDLIEKIIERISDHALKVVSHHDARQHGNPEQIESARQAVFQAEDWIKRDLRILAARPASNSGANTCLHQIQEPAPVMAAPPLMTAALFAARGALQHLKEGGKPTESLLNEAISAIDSVATSQAAPAAVAVPDAVRDAEKLLRAEAARLERIYGSHGNKWYGFSDEKAAHIEHLRVADALAATPAANSVELHQIKTSAPVVLPEPWGYLVEGRIFIGRLLPQHLNSMAESEGFQPTKLFTEQKLRAALLAGVSAPAAQWLQPKDWEALQRFEETASDNQGHDIGKAAVARLAGFGCLQSHGFEVYSITDFGHFVLDDWEHARALPFRTQAERDADQRAAIAAQAAQQGGAA